MKKQYLVFAILIIFLGAIPRSIEVLAGNYLFGFDQGLFYQDVKRIVVDHKLTLIGSFTGGQGGLFQGAGWYYLLSIPFFLRNGDPYGGMILMLLLGISTVALSIYFGSKMFGRVTGLTIGFLIAVSPSIISQSRFIWPPFPVSLLTVLYLYFIYKVFHKKEKYLFFASFVIGLMSHFELATAGTFFLQFLFILPILLYKKFVSLKFILLSLGSFMLTLLPLILFNIRHDNIILKGVLNMLPNDSSKHNVTQKYIEHMFLNHLDVFRLNFLSSFHLSDQLWSVILLVLILGGILYVKDKKTSIGLKWFILYLLTSPIMLFLVFMLYLWPMWQWWLLQLIIIYNFAFGVISIYLWNKFQNLRVVFLAIYIIFTAAFISQTVNFYKNDFHDYGGTAKMKGKIDALDYIYKDASGEKFGLLVFTPPVYTFAYDYLLWWHGERNYGYIPYNEKKGTFYLLIEPDPHKPWSYKGWLETVVKTGKVIKTVELPSGFIIEKRVEENEKI